MGAQEPYELLLRSGFQELSESDDLAWDFDGAFHSRSLMFSFTLVASIGYGDMYPMTNGGRIFCVVFTCPKRTPFGASKAGFSRRPPSW